MVSPQVTKVSILGKESIHIGYSLIPYIASTLISTLPSSTYVLITDTNLSPLYLSSFSSSFESLQSSHAHRFISHVISPGEMSKSRETKAKIEDWLLEMKCTRDTVIIALGGGVVGDLVGFTAATFMRGVRLVQVPTTLLAMVDSSIGGKTAIDAPAGKNLIGAFWQPEYIFIDCAFLATLPAREFNNGMAEVIKTAAIWDASSFSLLETNASLIRSAAITSSNFSSSFNDTSPHQLLLSAIKSSISIKSHIVTLDERETGLRNLVNFGHTIGHAIEGILTPDLLHGECVAIGMILEAEVSRALGKLGDEAVGRLERVLKSFDLPTSLSDGKVKGSTRVRQLGVGRLMDLMSVDKKNVGKNKKVVLLERIGKCVEERASTVDDRVIVRVLSPNVQLLSPPSNYASTKPHTVLTTPGSKSISNRALLLAALGEGKCKLENLLHSDDTKVMIAALEKLGRVGFEWVGDGEAVVVSGGGGKLVAPEDGKEIYLGNAGTAARFITTVATLCAPSSEQTRTIVTGNARMKQRPIGPLVDSLLSNGSDIEYLESKGCLPLSIAAGGFKGGELKLSASISSQYVSSILLSAPYAKEEVRLELVGGEVISQPYIDMTIQMMKDFGVQVERLKDAQGKLLDVYRIPRGGYKNPAVYAIESDASSATYPLALAAITGTTVTVKNIGSKSLQGDSRFAKMVLEPMGCEVTESEEEIKVTGPAVGSLRPLGSIDMELMTDAFMTAVVLAAVAKPAGDVKSTKITGIANQRVKECNRIAAMREQLIKFGVVAEELADGIEIFGIDKDQLKKGASVFCYDDHRIAMAFSVLASIPTEQGKELNAVIQEKHCVGKTWPNWWDELAGKFGIEIVGNDDHEHQEIEGAKYHYEKDASVILIGMRGAGKTTVGKVGAQSLGRPFIDADEVFEEKLENVRNFVKKYGWPEFRKQEVTILKELLTEKKTGYVISLGGGVVETPEARELLKEYGKTTGPVVHIVRDIKEILDFLHSETHRPSLGEPLQDIWARRKPWFEECSTCDFISYVGMKTVPGSVSSMASTPQLIDAEGKPVKLQDIASSMASSTLSKAGADSISRFFRFVSGFDTNHVDLTRPRTSFVALTFPIFTSHHPTQEHMDEITAGVDAVELRVDLLSPDGKPPKEPHIPPSDFVATQLAALRKLTNLPVVFTVRTFSQGGMFPDNAEKEAFALLNVARRLGAEYIDMECKWAPERMSSFYQSRGYSRILASWHDWSGGLKWDSKELRDRYESMKPYGDIIKIISKAETLRDNYTLMNFRETAKKDGKPLLSINMGRDGQLSRILNPTFTIVTHGLLPSAAAPGQLTFVQVQQALHLLGQLPKKKFYLLGYPISQSKSPLIHNFSFEKLGLPHHYSLHECLEVDQEVEDVIRAPDFGGASVTIPHKIEIMRLMDSITEDAKAIGAVNTIIPFTDSKTGKVSLIGDNTDWLGITGVLKKSLTVDHEITTDSTALVLGAGGTCRAAVYALSSLGFKKIYLYNRTFDNSKKIQDAFPSFNIVPIDSLDIPSASLPSIVISTVPANATSTLRFPNPKAGISLPAKIISRPQGGVVLDMAYRPKRTPLIDLAIGAQGWKTVTGIEVLLEQAYWQFEKWTGMKSPRGLVEKRVISEYDREEGL